MKSRSAIKFKNGAMIHLAKDLLSDHHRRLIDSLIISKVPFIINTGLSTWAYNLVSTSPVVKTKFYNSTLRGGARHDVEMLEDLHGLNGHIQEAVKILSREVNCPIIINASLDPNFAKDLRTFNEGYAFVIAGCQITNGNLNVGILGDSGDVWMDEQAIEVPKFKNEPCVSPGVKLFKDLMDVVSDDVSVPAVTLKQLQDKAVKYDVLIKDFNVMKQAYHEALPEIKKTEKLIELFKVAYENGDNMQPYEFMKKLAEILLHDEEPETFDRADYRDE